MRMFQGFNEGDSPALLLVCLASISGCAVESRDDADVGAITTPLAVNLAAAAAPEDFGAVDVGSGPQALPAEQLRGRASELTPDDLTRLKARPNVDAKGIDSNQQGDAAPDWRAALRESVNGNPGDREVRIIVSLPDEAFPWHEFRNRVLTNENRNELVQARQRQLSGRLEAVEARLIALGAHDVVRMWIAPAISAMLPARAFESVSRWDDIADASRDDNRPMLPQVAYRPGIEGRLGTRASAFIAAGYKGQDGHAASSSQAVRAAVFDVNDLVYGHPGFQRPDGSSRIVSRRRCGNGLCISYTPNQADSHGTIVLGVLGGSIEGGQDPNFTTASDTLRRSGYASEANLYYYAALNNDLATNLYLVAQTALTSALDVVNFSWNTGCFCSSTCDSNGANAVLSNSTDGGVLFVVSAGNSGAASCNVGWPATSRDVLAVGGLNSIDVATPYDASSMWSGSSRGGMDIVVNGSTKSQAVKLVDLVAPACYSLLYTAPDSYNLETCGTSLAAPTVAGNAAILLNSFFSLGFSLVDARLIQTYLLMMGDGWNAESGATMSSGLSRLSGAGRLKNHFMSNANLTAPWAWGCHKATLTASGQVRTYGVSGNPQSVAVQTWKAALTWKEPHLNNSADITLRVRNTCPSQVLAGDVTYDVRKRIRLSQATINGKCLEYDVSAVHIPAGESRTFTVCDYLQSGSAANH
jgi:hypothetical protein